MAARTSHKTLSTNQIRTTQKPAQKHKAETATQNPAQKHKAETATQNPTQKSKAETTDKHSI